MGLKIQDGNIADFGIDAMTDDGVKELTPAKSLFTVDNYNAMLERAVMPGDDSSVNTEDLREKTMSEEKDYEIIDTNTELARSLGLRGTPASIINDTIIPGYVKLINLKEIITQ